MTPPEIKERLIPGHWVGHLIRGARNASAIGTQELFLPNFDYAKYYHQTVALRT